MSYNIEDTTSYEREVAGLVKFLKAFNQYQGIIITWDTERQITEDGVIINAIPVWKWLLFDSPSVEKAE